MKLMDTVIVSALYRVDSKRPIKEYITRAEYLILNTVSDMVIYTTTDVQPLLPKRKGVTTVILPIEEFYSQTLATKEEYESMAGWYSNVTAKKPIGSDLLRIYAEKHMFVNRTIDRFPGYSYYVWSDIGIVWGRCVTHYLKTYPSISKINSLNLGDKICFSIREAITLEEYTTGFSNHRLRLDAPIAGSIILGNKVAWRNFIKFYHKSFECVRQNNKCWGNDEHIYFHMLCKNPDNFTGINVVGVELPVQKGYAITWNRMCFLLSDVYANRLDMFEPITPISGYPNIVKASWGFEDKQLDVTQYFREKKDTSNITLSYKLFKTDPAPGKAKQLRIEYDTGVIDTIQEYSTFGLIEHFPDIWSFVDKVVYINLAKRPDRRKHMEKFTKTFGDKVIRFEAIENKRGEVGCSQSHIEVLKMALKEGWKNVLVLEDDLEWNKFNAGYKLLKKLVDNPYDVITLGTSNTWDYDSKTYRIMSSTSTGSYLVNGHYIPTLLENFEEGCQKLIECGVYSGWYAVDRYWIALQSRDKWYATIPNLIYQQDGFSDIEHTYRKNITFAK